VQQSIVKLSAHISGPASSKSSEILEEEWYGHKDYGIAAAAATINVAIWQLCVPWISFRIIVVGLLVCAPF
jgi:hypothetical protein